MRPREWAESVDAYNSYALGETPFGRALFNPSIGGEPGLTPGASQFNLSTDALCGATELTLLCSFWRRGAVDPSVQWMNFRTDYGHTMDVFGSSTTQLTFGADWSGAWNGASQQTVTIGDGLVTIAAVIRQDGARFFCNGVMTGTKSGGGFTIYSEGAAPYAVSVLRGARSPVLLQAAWKTALFDRHAAELTRLPWKLFEPITEPAFYSLGGGGSAALDGVATSGASATGSLSTAIPILGAAVSGATASGSLSTAISLAGATATISGTAAGDLSATIRLAGDAVSGAIAAGGLATGIPLVGDGTGGAAGAGDLSTGSGLAGAGAAGAAGTGVLTTQITLSGAAIAQAIASGALTTTPAGLAGDGTSSASGSGALSTGIPLAGAAAVSVVGTGGLVTAIPLAGAATVAVSATGDLVVSLGLAGAALISAIGSGALLASITLNGAAVTGAVGAGALSGAALHASPWRTVTSLARVRSARATARVRRCIAGVR